MMFPASAFDSDDDRSVSSNGSGSTGENSNNSNNNNGIMNQGGFIPNVSDDEGSVGSNSSSGFGGTPMGTGAMLLNTNRNSNTVNGNNNNTNTRSTATATSRNTTNNNNNNNSANIYADIYASSSNSSSGTGAMNLMNLKELDAYVHETVRAQRQQRRRETCTKLILLLGLVVVVATMLGSSLFVWQTNDAKKTTKNHKGSSSSTPKIRNKATQAFVLEEGYQMSQCEGQLNMGRSFSELIYATEQMEQSWGKCRPEVPNCDWINPTLATERHDNNTVVAAEWHGAFQFNVHHIQGLLSDAHRSAQTYGNDDDGDDQDTNAHLGHPSNLDVVLIGDSIVEHWEGKDMGISEPSLHRDHEVFEELFTRHGGGVIDGMAHGIGGDRCAHLLYRLEHGEMPEGFNPKVWWLLVGTEDWKQGVDSDTIVAGVLKIVQTIQAAHPHSHVVINSILPRGNERRGENPHYEALHDINRRLECFVATENQKKEPKVAIPKLAFFNATSIFLFEDPEVGYFVNPALLPDFVHPSPQGEEIWGRKIVDTVLKVTGRGTEVTGGEGA